MLSDHILYSHDFSERECVDITTRNWMLITNAQSCRLQSRSQDLFSLFLGKNKTKGPGYEVATQAAVLMTV